MSKFVVTGGFGVGKTTLIDQLAKTFAVVPEPARQLLTERAEMASDPSHFVEALVERSIDNYQSAPKSEVAVFDRGLPDCVAYAAIYGLDTSDLMRTAAEYPYLNPVFIAPPWPEIYENDKLRRATFEQSAAFSEHVVEAYEGLGYDLVEVPLAQPHTREAFVMSAIRESLTDR